MLYFELITWALFGVILGGFVGFFMEREEGHTTEYLVRGAIGGVVGGVAGQLLVAWLPSLRFDAGGYDFTSLLISMMFACLFIYVDRKTHRRGRDVFRDARPDVP